MTWSHSAACLPWIRDGYPTHRATRRKGCVFAAGQSQDLKRRAGGFLTMDANSLVSSGGTKMA